MITLHYNETSNRLRWAGFDSIPLSKRREWTQDADYIVFGTGMSVSSCNCPEDDAYDHAYIPGSDTDHDAIEVRCRTGYSIYYYIEAIRQWSKEKKLNIVFCNELSGNNSMSPYISCPTCKSLHLVNNLVRLGENYDLVCPTCAGNISTCSECNRAFVGEFCPSCYEMGECAYCGEEELIRRTGDATFLCDRHKNVTKVKERHYSWKPDGWKYRRLV